uniref:RPGRIP1 like n=1 Tax=Sinocyclocheilus rhinocerous TaxID=307959 RepID=A0A673G6M1_9TELE
MMFARADETAGDIPVKEPEWKALLSQNVRKRQNVSKFSREELEDTFLRLQEENLTLKQHACQQEDKIRRMATKLIRLVKDRKQSEGGRDVEMEEMMEELQEKVQELEKQNDGLKRRLHIQPRINSGLRRLTDDIGIRHVEGDMSAKPPQGLLPRYGHSLLDEARAEIHDLENVIESQQAQMEEMERSAEMLRDQLKRKEREFEESLLQMRAHQASGQRLTIKDNMEMIKLQKLLSEKANALTVLEGRFLQQQESMKTLKASHDAALVKVDEVSRQLKEERLKGLQLETQIQTRALDQRHTQEAEVEAVTRAMDDLKLEHELNSEKLAQLLDMRAAKIKKLEAQLKDIAYGAKTHVFRPDVTSDDVTDEFDETLRLARGENLMEINLGRAQFSSEAIESLKNKDPSTFCTYAFYDFELQSTAVVRGAHPAYSLTSQYLVRVDDLFLNYLHSSSVTVEVQLAEGLSFRTVAAGQLRLNQLLERGGKVFSTIQLVGESRCLVLKLRVPMEQAIRLYKERVKALGYLNTSMRDSQVLSSSLMDGDLNELNITIHSCCDLRSRGPHTQPSPYIIYKLYDFPDHDTPIISSTNEPQFEDHMVFPVAMNSDLDALLRSEALVLYVFDDLDVANQLYLGKARVPLISLAHDKTITGMFELTDPEGLPSGQISVTLKWTSTYLPPASSAITTQQTEITGRTTPERQTAQDKEKTQTETRPMTKDPPLIPQPTVSEVMASPKHLSIQDHTVHKSTVIVLEAGEATAVSEEGDEEESQFSEGQVITAGCMSVVIRSCDALLHQPSECIRVEIVTLSLKPGSRVAEDSGIVRLFVEYCFLGLPSVETPLSLKKPLPGHSVSYNFSNVIHVDKESNQPRRQTLRAVLEGRNKQLEHIKFTVVSDPPKEECEDVGVAYLRILDIMEKRTDMKDVSLNIVDVQDNSAVIGHLVVTVEALEALTSIMKDPERDRPLTTLA